MKTRLSVMIAIMLLSTAMMGQKFITKNGEISFYSSTPVEDIEAHNKQVNAALDIETGAFVFRVLIQSFQFEKALMQEHFNENYMESHKYPNATFQGMVDMNGVDFSKEGTYETIVEGKLTIHGVTQNVKKQGTFVVREGKIRANSTFMLKVADYDIKIPKTVINNIAEEIEVTVNAEMQAVN